jgi:hypothetical protein
MWPPIWVGVGQTSAQTPPGEIGELVEIRRYADRPRRLFMIMRTQGREYTGALLFDDDRSCDQIQNLLRRCQGAAIVDVGNLDVPLDPDEICIYRRAASCQTWHCCSNCSHWPAAGFDLRTTPPAGDELCNQCKTLLEQQGCR